MNLILHCSISIEGSIIGKSNKLMVIKNFMTVIMGLRLIRQMYSRTWVANERPNALFDFATSWLIDNKVLLPGVTVLIRLVAEVRELADKRLWRRLASILTEEQARELMFYCKLNMTVESSHV